MNNDLDQQAFHTIPPRALRQSYAAAAIASGQRVFDRHVSQEYIDRYFLDRQAQPEPQKPFQARNFHAQRDNYRTMHQGSQGPSAPQK